VNRALVFFIRQGAGGAWSGFAGWKKVRDFESREAADAWYRRMQAVRSANISGCWDRHREGHSKK
jgi:hypothetical protein